MLFRPCGFLSAAFAVSTATLYVGCAANDDSPPVTAVQTATSLEISGVTSLDAINAQVSLTAIVRDQKNVVMTGVPVSWTSERTDVATVNPSTGVVTAVQDGSARVTARAGNATNGVTIVVAQVATQLSRVSGDSQRGTVGSEVPEALTVRALDALGTPVAATPVAFVIVEGGGTLTPATASTDVSGIAVSRWTLGTSTTDSHRVRASLQLRPETIAEFTATAIAGMAASLQKQSGDQQNAPTGQQVPKPISVGVTDRYNNPVAQVEVQFSPGNGSGSVSPALVRTSSSGEASTTWTLGAETAQSLVVSAPSVGLPSVTFTATGLRAPTDTAAAPARVDSRRSAVRDRRTVRRM